MKISSVCILGAVGLLYGCGFSSADQLFDGTAGAGGTTSGSSGTSGAAGTVSGKAGASGSGVAGMSSGGASMGKAGSPTGTAGSSTGTAGATGTAGSSMGKGGATGTAGKGGKGGAPPTDCASQGNNCTQCCDDSSNGAISNVFVEICGCAKGAECQKACGQNLCANQQPSMQCINCLNGIDGGAQCLDNFQSACEKDPDCAAAIPCLQTCQ